MVKRLSRRKNTLKRNSLRRKNTLRRKTVKGGFIGMQCGEKWKNINQDYNKAYNKDKGTLYTHILDAKNNYWGTNTVYTIQMKIKIKNNFNSDKEEIIVVIEIPKMKLKDIKKLRDRIKNNRSLNKKLKVDTYNFKEYVRGDRNNCNERFNQIDNFFKHIKDKIEGGNALLVIKIIKILKSMRKLPNNFKPKFEDLNGKPFLDKVIIEDPDGIGTDVVLQEGDWIG